MKSKNNYFIIFAICAPFLVVSQNISDTTSIVVDEIQTSKVLKSTPVKPIEEITLAQKTTTKSQPQLSKKDMTIKGLLVEEKIIEKQETPIVELQQVLEEDLVKIEKQLSVIDLEYRDERILKIKKEEAEYDLSFLKRLDGIKETITHETTGNSEAFVIASERFLDTLLYEETNVSDRFKDLSRERYDNYLAKEKIIKLEINDVTVQRVTTAEEDSDKLFKYSGFAKIPNLDKKIRVEFFSNGYVRKADQRLIYKVAKVDDIDQTIIIEGLISNYRYGRIPLEEEEDVPVFSLIQLEEWIIMERLQLMQDYKNSKKK